MYGSGDAEVEATSCSSRTFFVLAVGQTSSSRNLSELNEVRITPFRLYICFTREVRPLSDGRELVLTSQRNHFDGTNWAICVAPSQQLEDEINQLQVPVANYSG